LDKTQYSSYSIKVVNLIGFQFFISLYNDKNRYTQESHQKKLKKKNVMKDVQKECIII